MCSLLQSTSLRDLMKQDRAPSVNQEWLKILRSLDSWLSSEIVDMYAELLLKKSSREHEFFLYSSLSLLASSTTTGAFKPLRRWQNANETVEVKYILAPICSNSHFILVIGVYRLRMGLTNVLVLDPFGPPSRAIMGRVITVFSCIRKSLTGDAGNTNFQLEAEVLKVNTTLITIS